MDVTATFLQGLADITGFHGQVKVYISGLKALCEIFTGAEAKSTYLKTCGIA